MSGVALVMATLLYPTAEDVLREMLFVFGPGILVIASLVLSFSRKCKWQAFTMAIVGCVFAMGILPAHILWHRQGVWNTTSSMGWSIKALFWGIPFLLGIVTIGRVYYLHRKERKQPPGP